MSKIVTIPTGGGNPFVVILGGIKYVYKPGETVEVPDGVALEIEEWERWHKKYYGENEPPFGNALDDITTEVGQAIVVKSVDEDGKPTEWEAANLLSEWKTLVSLTVEEEIDYMVITTDVDGNSFDFSDVSEVIVYMNATGTSGGGYHPNVTLGNALVGSPVKFAVGEDIINIASMHAVFFNGGHSIVSVATAGKNYEAFSVSGTVKTSEWDRTPKIVFSNATMLPGARLLILAR